MLILEMWLKTKLPSCVSPWRYLWMPKEPTSHPALRDTSFIYYMAAKTEGKHPVRRHECILVHSTSYQSSSYITLSRSFFRIRNIFQDVPLWSLSSRRISHIRLLALPSFFFFFNLCTCAMCRNIKIQRVLSHLFVSQLVFTRCPPANKHLQHPVIYSKSS